MGRIRKYSRQVKTVSVGIAALAIVASPVVASAATGTDSTTVNALVGSAISITSGPSVNVSLTPGATSVTSSASDAVGVSTNNVGGYTLTLANGDATRALDNGDGSTIAAHAGTHAVPTALAVNTWGYAIAGGAFDSSYAAQLNTVSSTTKWAGVPAAGSGVTLKTTASAATNDITTVWYGVHASPSLPSGTYSDTVTYTATTN